MSECCICHKELSRKDVEYYFWSGADKYELCKTCKGVIDQSKLNDDAYNLLMKALSRLPDDQSRRIKIQFNILDEETRREEAEEEVRYRRVTSQMLISSGFNFEGYRIVKYSGYISGDDAVQIPRTGWFLNNNNGQNLTDALVKIRRRALLELKRAAYDLGCNAVIGVDFDYITLDPQTANITGGTTYEPYVICVTANGNAVVVEKIE